MQKEHPEDEMLIRINRQILSAPFAEVSLKRKKDREIIERVGIELTRFLDPIDELGKINEVRPHAVSTILGILVTVKAQSAQIQEFAFVVFHRHSDQNQNEPLV
ncbi:MAG: hypothetical protein ACK4S4_09130 [Pyrinomonadaceae bacterium]